MALFEKHLEVKTSTIPDSGKGLFTKAFIPKGSYVAEYTGRKVTWDDVRHDAGNMYIYYVDDELVIDGREDLSSPARYANDANGITKVKGLRNNARYIYDEGKVYIEAMKDIPAGAEILVSYGRSYWNTVRKNMKADEEELQNKRA